MVKTGGQTRLMGVIGDPVRHSLSPAIHSRFIQEAGVDAVYLAFPVHAGGVAAFIRAARQMEMLGFNVTMPLKEESYRTIGNVEGCPSGAVNTVVLSGDAALGYNTDADGFLSVLQSLGLPPTGLSVVILGAGGTAAALCHALHAKGARVSLCVRNPVRAQALPCDAILPFAEAASACRRADVLVNATPLGMTGFDPFPSLDFVGELPARATVLDMVYRPAETRLCLAARERRLIARNGLLHLIHQAALSFTHFTGIRPNPETLDALYGELQGENQNEEATP